MPDNHPAAYPPIVDNSLYRRKIIRPISKFIAPFFSIVGLDANRIGWIKLIFGLAGAFLLASKSATMCFGGMLLMQMHLLLDAVDGEVARLRGTAGWLSGEYIDKLFDHLPKTAMYFFWGYGTFRLSGSQIPLFCGIFLAAWNIYPRFCLVEVLLERLDKAPGVIHNAGFHRALGAAFVTQKSRGRADFFLTMFVHPVANLLTFIFLFEVFLPEIEFLGHTLYIRMILLMLFTSVSVANYLRKATKDFRVLNFSYMEPPTKEEA
jgi:phosphatidylglycerophosphate synthase